MNFILNVLKIYLIIGCVNVFIVEGLRLIELKVISDEDLFNKIKPDLVLDEKELNHIVESIKKSLSMKNCIDIILTWPSCWMYFTLGVIKEIKYFKNKENY